MSCREPPPQYSILIHNLSLLTNKRTSKFRSHWNISLLLVSGHFFFFGLTQQTSNFDIKKKPFEDNTFILTGDNCQSMPRCWSVYSLSSWWSPAEQQQSLLLKSTETEEEATNLIASSQLGPNKLLQDKIQPTNMLRLKLLKKRRRTEDNRGVR